MRVKIAMGDWMLTMGLIGLYRIYRYGVSESIVPQEDADLVRINQFGLAIDSRALQYLPEAFFRYMLNEHSVFDREQQKLEALLTYGNKETNFDNALKNIKDVVSDNYKKIAKYFPGNITERLKGIQNQLKGLKRYQDWNEVEQCVKDFLNVLAIQPVDEKLTLNYFKAVVMGPFFGQPSFLNVSKTKLDLQGHMDTFFNDYIYPVLVELAFQDYLNNGKRDELLAHFEQERNYKPFSSLRRQLQKLNSIEEMQHLVYKQVPECSLIPGLLAFGNYEEMIFSPLGVSAGKALNFQWDFDGKQPIPVSSLAKLVLFCAPAGAAIYGRWEGKDGQGRYDTYAGFIQTDGSFQEIMQRNDTFKTHKDRKDPFDRILSVLVEDLKKEAGHIIEHLFFVEFSSDYSSKKTLLEYYHLPKYLASYIHKYGENLDKIRPFSFREQFVKAVLLGQDPIHVIFQHIKEQIKAGHSLVSGYIATRERNRILLYKQHHDKGVVDVKEQDRLIYAVYSNGREIREAYAKAEKMRDESEPYASSAVKKVTGIAYRLLNTVKAGNKREFMDAVFRLHMPLEKPVSPVFLNVLHERKLDFASVGTAFIAGLLSIDKEEMNKEVDLNG